MRTLLVACGLPTARPVMSSGAAALHSAPHVLRGGGGREEVGRRSGRVRQGGLPVPAREPRAGSGSVRRLPAWVVPLWRHLPPPAPHARHGAPPSRQAEAAHASIRRPGRPPGGYLPAPPHCPSHPSCLVPVCWHNSTPQPDVVQRLRVRSHVV